MRFCECTVFIHVYICMCSVAVALLLHILKVEIDCFSDGYYMYRCISVQGGLLDRMSKLHDLRCMPTCTCVRTVRSCVCVLMCVCCVRDRMDFSCHEF